MFAVRRALAARGLRPPTCAPGYGGFANNKDCFFCGTRSAAGRGTDRALRAAGSPGSASGRAGSAPPGRGPQARSASPGPPRACLEPLFQDRFAVHGLDGNRDRINAGLESGLGARGEPRTRADGRKSERTGGGGEVAKAVREDPGVVGRGRWEEGDEIKRKELERRRTATQERPPRRSRGAGEWGGKRGPAGRRDGRLKSGKASLGGGGYREARPWLGG